MQALYGCLKNPDGLRGTWGLLGHPEHGTCCQRASEEAFGNRSATGYLKHWMLQELLISVQAKGAGARLRTLRLPDSEIVSFFYLPSHKKRAHKSVTKTLYSGIR
ncbi:hypothetical protein NNO_0561 [Hydrogenimonas sp.]|nr:hypothetical protein NNO_0561 [Hydrogenimonas sp.]